MGGYGNSDQAQTSCYLAPLVPVIRKPFVVPVRNSDSYSAPNVNRSSEPEGYVTRRAVPVASPGRNSDSYSAPNVNRSSEPEGYVTRRAVPVASPGRNSDSYSAPNVNRSSEPEGYVTRRAVPVASSYDYGDEYKDSSPSPNQAYPSRNDEGWRQQTSPVHGRPQKVDDFLNKIQIQANRPANGYGGDYRNKPTGGDHLTEAINDLGNAIELLKVAGNPKLTPSDHSTGVNGGINGNGGYGEHGNKDNGFGGDYEKKEGYKPTGGTIWKDNNDYRENIDSREATKRSEKFNYRENIDKSVAPRRFGNLTFGPIINSTEAEKKYGGTRV